MYVKSLYITMSLDKLLFYNYTVDLLNSTKEKKSSNVLQIFFKESKEQRKKEKKKITASYFLQIN